MGARTCAPTPLTVFFVLPRESSTASGLQHPQRHSGMADLQSAIPLGQIPGRRRYCCASACHGWVTSPLGPRHEGFGAHHGPSSSRHDPGPLTRKRTRPRTLNHHRSTPAGVDETSTCFRGSRSMVCALPREQSGRRPPCGQPVHSRGSHPRPGCVAAPALYGPAPPGGRPSVTAPLLGC